MVAAWQMSPLQLKFAPRQLGFACMLHHAIFRLMFEFDILLMLLYH